MCNVWRFATQGHRRRSATNVGLQSPRPTLATPIRHIKWRICRNFDRDPTLAFLAHLTQMAHLTLMAHLTHMTHLPQSSPTAGGLACGLPHAGRPVEVFHYPISGYRGYWTSPLRTVQFSRNRLTTKHCEFTSGTHAGISDARATSRRSRIVSSLPRSSLPHPRLC